MNNFKILTAVTLSLLLIIVSACGRDGGIVEDAPPSVEGEVGDVSGTLGPDVAEERQVGTDPLSMVGTWESETGSISRFFQDGTGTTADDSGVHEFDWEIFTLSEMVERRSNVREFFRSVYSEEIVNTFHEDGWGESDYLLSLKFDEIPFPLDFPFTMEERDTLVVNAMNIGQLLSPTPNPDLRFDWVAFTKIDA